jgi:hypothetical protein
VLADQAEGRGARAAVTPRSLRRQSSTLAMSTQPKKTKIGTNTATTNVSAATIPGAANNASETMKR